MNSQQGTRTQTSEAAPGGCWPLLLGTTSGKWGQDPSGAAWLSTTSPSRRDKRVVFLPHRAVTQTGRPPEGKERPPRSHAEGDNNQSHSV